MVTCIRKTSKRIVEPSADGKRMRQVMGYSYIALLTKIYGVETKAVRVEYFSSKNAAYDRVKMDYPEWNIKYIVRLNDRDFQPW